jgi:transcriptional regulator with PAS, ATPase and Fis domain
MIEHTEQEKEMARVVRHEAGADGAKVLEQISDGIVVDDMLIGQSRSSQQLLRELSFAASCEAICLLIGETGTGKDLAARHIHRNSARAEKPFVVVNLPAIPKDLVESALFGHERGAFTGAVLSQEGKFEAAADGTIFLDEIGDLPVEHQIKLLRVIENGEIERVGSNKNVRSNARIIAATSRPLGDLMGDLVFRKDLYYRLMVMPVCVPPLRERPDDIRPLSNYFLGLYAKKYGKQIEDLSEDLHQIWRRRPWTGNIRELSHLIERMIIYASLTKKTLEISDLPLEVLVDSSATRESKGIVHKIEEYERLLILEALGNNGFNRSSAARELKIPVETLRYRMNKLGIKKERPPKPPPVD